MGKEKSRDEKRPSAGNGLLNVGLVVFGLISLLLLVALVMRIVQPRVDPQREENPTALVGKIIQVEVRNGCGVAGLAGITTRYLRDHGFDVVGVGDYIRFDLDSSVVVDRVGDLAAARKVALVLGLPEDRVRQELQPGYYLDASVLIGKDYPTLAPFQDE